MRRRPLPATGEFLVRQFDFSAGVHIVVPPENQFAADTESKGANI